jgi:plastocyanin
MNTNRRRLLETMGMLGALVVGAGCTDRTQEGSGGGTTATDTSTTQQTTGGTTTGGDGTTQVAAGPSGSLIFAPEAVTVSVGDTVVWTFRSPGHNVSAKPDASGEIAIPEGAEPFASYEGNDYYSLNEEEATYEHTFDTAGEYTYVCVPHINQGMVGTVTVSE